MNPFSVIIRNLDKLQQNVNFIPPEPKTRATNREHCPYIDVLEKRKE